MALTTLIAPAAALAQDDIPPTLKDWQGWVLRDELTRACPALITDGKTGDDKQCVWPGRLALDAGEHGAQFTLTARVDGRAWLDLPGDAQNWPQQVMVNGKTAVVLSHSDVPSLLLEPGNYTVSGVLPWEDQPARLRVPNSIALVSLTLDGNAVERIERNDDELTLGEASAEQRAADALSMRVLRKLADGLPAILQTRLQLDVTGSAREQLLGPVLPKGFTALSLQGDLPARIESDGRLRVQLRPGHWVISIGARSDALLQHVNIALSAPPWPAQEIWSYADAASLRGTRVDGQAVDATQAGVPDDWRKLPAYALDSEHGLDIEPSSRAGVGGQGDQISLRRDLWLNFDASGFDVIDRLTGALRNNQRLEVDAPWQLQSALQNGQPSQVTLLDGRGGVEVRGTTLALRAGLRLPDQADIPVSGWRLPLQNVGARLHLPYGYRLIGTTGVDEAPNSWVASWSLLDLFAVALIALLAGRFLGWPWAGVAAVLLALSHSESGAPYWILAATLALALLMRALPDGMLRRVCRWGALAVLLVTVLWSLPFASTQISDALHPQLEGRLQIKTKLRGFEGRWGLRGEESVGDADINPSPPPPSAPAPAVANAVSADGLAVEDESDASTQKAPAKGAARAKSSLSKSISLSQNIQFNPDAYGLLQAGRGVPGWDTGNDYALNWSGPVSTQQTARLLIAPAWLVRILRVMMLALLVALLGKLALSLLRPPSSSAPLWRWRGGKGGGAAAASLLLALTLTPHHDARAQSMPSEDMLHALHDRLMQPPACTPDCATLAQAAIQVQGDTLTLTLLAHAGAALALPLPQGDDALQLLSVSVDGQDALLARNQDQGLTLVKLDRGVHSVVLRYHVSPADTTTLHFPLPPQRAVFQADAGWTVNGLDDARMLGDSVTLSRARANDDGKVPSAVDQAFAPYVRLTRTLKLDTEWTVINSVQRIAPADAGFSLDLPLLPGEHPLDADARVHDGRIGVTFSAGQNQVSWTSRLDRADALTLNAPALSARAEQWVFQSAPIWHLQSQGVPAIVRGDGLLFQPLPGETLHMSIAKPEAGAGGSLAFDEVMVDSRVGDRSSTMVLTLQARSTRGGDHVISLPAGAELLRASRDGESLSLTIHDGKVGLPILPGTHVYVLSLREPTGATFATRAPVFALDAPAANFSLSQQLPQSRWVLWAWGPTAGPAVLYWSRLVMLVLVAALLARYAPTPLRFYQWLLLGLGFSAFDWGAYAFVVTWLILLGLRERHVASGRYVFNVLQVALALLTVIALVVLVSAIPEGLLGLPDMQVAGNGSSAWRLNWFADQTIGGSTPEAGAFSVSLWVYKIAMLLWALWLANVLVSRWLRWGLAAWKQGGYWRAGRRKNEVDEG